MRSKIRVWVASVLAILMFSALVVGAPSRAEALTGNDFDPGYIISDGIFFNSASMSEAQIQQFLAAQLPSCAQSNGIACIRNYTESYVSRPAAPGGQCGAFPGGTNESASRIVFKVAQVCGINPQVILATLQKERGLITKSSPVRADYQVAMGYGCPDTAPCDVLHYGFANQVYRAAWQFREYTIHPSSWRYRVGAQAVQYHPNSACGAPVINIRNQATANLYNYTPYQPNIAALRNLNGSGDACSAYGNRNFWVYFNSWFGSSVGAVNPVSGLEVAQIGQDFIRVAGWAFDPDTRASVEVHVYVNGVGTGTVASLDRPDIDRFFGGIGAQRGFDTAVPLAGAGVQNVCVYAINQGPGVNTVVGCRVLVPPAASPIGSVERVTPVAGGVSLAGWTLDPSTPDSLVVHAFIDSVPYGVEATLARADVAAIYPAYGPLHGFDAVVPASPGPHNVCLVALNKGRGDNASLGCRVVVVPDGSPTGSVEAVTAVPGAFAVSGWALDPDSKNSIPVHVYVGATGRAYLADKSRPDVAAAYARPGGAYGFTETVPAAPGVQNVCTYALNIAGGGANPLLGCRTLVALSGDPYGSLEGVTGGAGQIVASGWVIDPDIAAAISVRVDVDGVVTEATAGLSRPDVARVYPQYGPSHGFTATLAANPGVKRVCVTAVDQGPGVDVSLGCRLVTVS